MSDARKYKLGPGGLYVRLEDDRRVVYKVGDPIWCDAEQAKGASLKGRLLPWVETAETFAAAGAPQPVDTSTTSIPLLPSRAEGDFAFIHNMPAADAIMRIREMDDSAQLGALADTEKLHPSTKGGRRSVLNEISKRRRQLALEKAREKKKAKAASADEAKPDNE